MDHMTAIDLDEKFQSGFKNLHSTETALLYVTDRLRISSDNNRISFLISLDLSSAFDTLDHPTLIEILSSHLGISGTALYWFRSYLENRSTIVLFNGNYSESKPLKYGVPQGSVLGPLLFRIYLLPLLCLLKQLGLSFHIYADDTQIYICCSLDDYMVTLNYIKSCYTQISYLLSKLFLKLNDSKTEIILIGKKNIVDTCKSHTFNIEFNNSIITFSSFIKNLGVTFDENLTFEKHIKTIANNAMLRLRVLRRVRSHFDKSSFEIIVHSVITSRLDYCNSLLSGMPTCSIRYLQLVQNYAARSILNKNKFCHVTPLLFKLHWLPIKCRINFKIILLIYKSLNGLAPSYLTDIIFRHESRHPLRSSDQENLVIPKFKTESFGGRAFSVLGPRLWNALPNEIKTSSSLHLFKKSLKTHLFSIHYDSLIL